MGFENQREWTDEDIGLLQQLFRAKVSDLVIAKALDRTAFAVGKKRSELSLKRDTHGGGHALYSAEEDRVLKAGFLAGKTDVKIAELIPNRTVGSIGHRREALGLIGRMSIGQRSSHVRRIENGEAPLRPNDCENAYKAATLRHLLDLKRAGHSPRQTELAPSSQGFEQVRFFPNRYEPLSLFGSSAALCSG